MNLRVVKDMRVLRSIVDSDTSTKEGYTIERLLFGCIWRKISINGRKLFFYDEHEARTAVLFMQQVGTPVESKNG
jgi:hypothetical protein